MRMLFREGHGGGGAGKPGAGPARGAGAKAKATPGRARNVKVVCARCGLPVANAGDTVSVGGSARHERVNPAAVVCRFTLYRRARGAVAVSAPETDFTWFDGYAWRVAECRRCGAHLGWRFDAAGGERAPGSFYGLLDERVREVDETHPVG